jgi:hypothetical protein
MNGNSAGIIMKDAENKRFSHIKYACASTRLPGVTSSPWCLPGNFVFLSQQKTTNQLKICISHVLLFKKTEKYFLD